MTPTRPFPEHLAEGFQLNATDTAGLLRLCEVLENLRDDGAFWQGLRAWVNRCGDNLAEKDAASGEPSAFVLGRRRELRCIPETLRETLAAVKQEYVRWDPPAAPPDTELPGY